MLLRAGQVGLMYELVHGGYRAISHHIFFAVELRYHRVKEPFIVLIQPLTSDVFKAKKLYLSIPDIPFTYPPIYHLTTPSCVGSATPANWFNNMGRDK